MEKLKRYAKFVSQIVAFVVAGAVGVLDDGKVSGVVEWTVLVTAIANAINVYVTPELRDGPARMAKGLTAIALAVAGAVTPALIVGGLDASEVAMLVSVALGALASLGLPNAGYRYAVKQGPLGDAIRAGG